MSRSPSPGPLPSATLFRNPNFFVQSHSDFDFRANFATARRAARYYSLVHLLSFLFSEHRIDLFARPDSPPFFKNPVFRLPNSFVINQSRPWPHTRNT